MPFFIIFVVIPLAEILVFMAVGEHIGLFTTLLLAFLTAIIGGWIVKYQGLQTIFKIRGSLSKGTLPAGALFDGLCLVAAGATLITPGFITDTIGFLLLIPPFRAVLKDVIKKHTTWFVQAGPNKAHKPGDGEIIEGEYESVDPDEEHVRITRIDD